MNYICHSGGCPGADMEWENEGYKYGIKTIAYSFHGHTQEGKNQRILTADELNEGFEHVKTASVGVKKNPNCRWPYVRNLLCRNWFQVKNSEAVFAIAKSMTSTLVDGGTGWAVQMAIDNKKPVFVFDQPNKTWFFFNYERGIFWPYHTIPKLTENFAGIGTREINEYGIAAIKKIFEANLSGVEEEQQTRFPVTEKIAGAAPVHPATYCSLV